MPQRPRWRKSESKRTMSTARRDGGCGSGGLYALARFTEAPSRFGRMSLTIKARKDAATCWRSFAAH